MARKLVIRKRILTSPQFYLQYRMMRMAL